MGRMSRTGLKKFAGYAFCATLFQWTQAVVSRVKSGIILAVVM